MSILLALIHTAIILAVSSRVRKRETRLKKFFGPALALKLVAGVSLGLVYTYYYSVSDTFVYFSDAVKLAALARRDFAAYAGLLFSDTNLDLVTLTFQEPRALLLTKITSVFCLLTNDNYWVTGFYYSLISFLAAWFLVKTLDRHIPAARNAALAAFLFLPSVVFWSSGLLKESLALAALYFLTAMFLKAWFGDKLVLWQYLTGVLALWICWNLKYYYVALFVPVVFTSLLYKYLLAKRMQSSPARSMLIWLAMFVFPVAIVSFFHPNFHAARLLDVVVENNSAYQVLSDPEDLIHFHHLEAAPFSFLKNAPWALFSGLFRPLFWETSALIQVLPGIENTVILLFFLAACLRYRTFFSSPLLLSATVYVVLLCILITLSTPNFGTLSRYRTGYISFFVMMILSNNPLLKYMERSWRRLVSK